MLRTAVRSVKRRLLSTQASASVKGADTGAWTTQQKVGLVLFGSLVGGTACLGVWQSTRYFWKVEQIELRKQGLAKEPSALAGSMEGLEGNRRYRVRGRFLHDKELRVGPRSPPKSMGAQAQGLGVSPQGHYVITPLEQADGSILLVNRGWVPLRGEVSRPSGEVVVTGVVSEGEKAGMFTPVNDYGSGKLLWVDVDGIRRWLGQAVGGYLIETTVDQGGASPSSRPTWPLSKTVDDMQDFHVMPPTHLVYAITWFSLSAFGAVASRRILFKQARPRA